MTLPSELAMNIRILKALGDVRPFGPCRHFYISMILRKLKRPNVITSEMLWRFLNLYFDAQEKAREPEGAPEREPFVPEEFGI